MENNIKSVRIDPDFARILLEMNTRNRPKSASIIKAYAEAMKAGNWKLNGETIKVTSDGFILDGQHRLEACVLSGVAFDTYFVEVEDANSFDTIDIGHKRTGAHVLAIQGEANYAVLSSALALLYQYEKKGRITKGSTRINPYAIEELLGKNPDMRISVNYACKYRNKSNLLSRSVCAFVHYIFSRIDADDAEKFMDQVMGGENLQRQDPAWAIRNRLMVEQTQRRHNILRNSFSIALLIKAWNLFRAGKPCHVLKYLETEDFPVPK